MRLITAQMASLLLHGTALMTRLDRSQPVRRKAVWGPKRVLAAMALAAFGLSVNGIAKAPSQSETAALNSAVLAKDLAAFEKLASDQTLRMEKAWAAEIQRALKNTNDAQIEALFYQLHSQRETAAAASSSYTEGDPAFAASASPVRKRPSNLSPLSTQTKIESPVTKARPGRPNFAAKPRKVDLEVERRRSSNPRGSTSVIVELAEGATLPAEFRQYAHKNNLGIINGRVLDVPNSVLQQLEARAEIAKVHHNRPVAAENYRTGFTTGARATQRGLGLTGAGVGIAIIDSGIATFHDDLTSQSATLYPYGNQRVSAFVDFVNGQVAPYDDQGHGTHVAGIIAGNGFDSNGQQMGVAPGASLVSLKVLDSTGHGTVGNIIAALDWVLAHHAQYNIRIVNVSVGAAVTESYWTDPLTLAAKRLVDAGIIVVSAAGNNGRNAAGETQYGAINAPGNAPWVITVGASSTNGNTQREDDTVTSFSSRGPSYLDWSAKPDLVAPGYGTISLADPLSAFYVSKAPYLQDGTVSTAYKPYLSLSGTSMAAPVVSGTIAQMLQANPSLTPNGVKAILQYTAQEYDGFNALTQGAGFVNTVGAVRLANFYAHAQVGQPVPVQSMWSKHIIWGNHLLKGGLIVPAANAFELGTNWGAATDGGGDNIVWGTLCGDGCDNIVWGTWSDDNIVWGTAAANDDNIVWGTLVDGDNIVWGTGGDDNIVWGTYCGGADCDNIVWGTVALDNIVWGTVAIDNIVWGTLDGDDNIVWGTDDVDNIVWGTDGADNIVWGTSDDDNIVWGTDGIDNIVWGTDEYDNIVWGTAIGSDIVWVTSSSGAVHALSWNEMLDRLSDEEIFTIMTSLSGGPRPIPPPQDPTSDPTAPPPPDAAPPPPPSDFAPPPPVDESPAPLPLGATVGTSSPDAPPPPQELAPPPGPDAGAALPPPPSPWGGF